MPKMFLLRRLTTADIRSRLMSVHARTLADSVTSFNAVHCNVSRTETGWFNDRTFMLGDLCQKAGLEPKPPITSLFYSGYALEEWCAARKVWTQLREIPNAAVEHSHHDFRVQRDRGQGHRSQQAGGNRGGWLQDPGSVHLNGHWILGIGCSRLIYLAYDMVNSE